MRKGNTAKYRVLIHGQKASWERSRRRFLLRRLEDPVQIMGGYKIGQELPQLLKGPLGYTDMVAAVIAGLAPSGLSAHGVALREYKRKPAWAFRGPGTSASGPIFSVHCNFEAAKAMGLSCNLSMTKANTV